MPTPMREMSSSSCCRILRRRRTSSSTHGRRIYWDKDGYTFDVKVTPASNNNNDYGEVTFHRTDDNGGWRNDIYFRAYFLNEEEKDPRPFDNSVPYLYEEDQYQPLMISSKGLLRKTSGHLRKHLENARSW